MYDDFVGCTLRSLVAANVSALRFSTRNLSPFSITGFVSSGLDHLSAELMESIDLMFYDSLLRALPALAQTLARERLNAVLQNAIAQEAPNVTSCKTSPDPRPPPAKSGADEYIDLSTSWVAVKLREYLKFLMRRPPTTSSVNLQICHRNPWSLEDTRLLIGVNSSTNISGVQADLQLGRLNLDVGNISFAGLDTLTN